MVLLLLVLLAWSLASSASAAKPCRAPLPEGPSVPAPIVLRTSCGGFRLAPDGEISRLPPRWFALRQGGTGRRYGADINVRRTRPGRIILLRRGRVVWRSSDLYRNDAGDIALGPSAFAFASYRRGVFGTDLRSPERLIVRGTGLSLLGFFRDGTLLVSHGSSITLLSQDGVVVRRYRHRSKSGFAFDERTGSLFFVTPKGVLARANGTSVRRLGPVGNLPGWMYLERRGLLVFQDDKRFAVVRRNGRLVARADWRRSRDGVLDSGPVASADNRTFALRVTKRSRAGPSDGTAVLHVLHAGGAQPHALYRHRLGDSGCAVGASLMWHGSFLLYSSTDGHIAVLGTRDRSAQTLTELAATLSRRGPGQPPSAYWASDFPRPRLPR